MLLMNGSVRDAAAHSAHPFHLAEENGYGNGTGR
jgi:hypothetical protein